MTDVGYTPFEDCPHTFCVGCGTCHVCEGLFPPRFIGLDRPSSLKGRAIKPRLRVKPPLPDADRPTVETTQSNPSTQEP